MNKERDGEEKIKTYTKEAEEPTPKSAKYGTEGNMGENLVENGREEPTTSELQPFIYDYANTRIRKAPESRRYSFYFDGNITPVGRLIVPMGEISYFSTTGTAVAIAAQSDGSTNMVVVAPTTALSSGVYEFDNGGSNNGRLRYTGADTKMFHTAITMSLSPAGANDTFVVGLAKGGTVVAASKILQKVVTAGDTQAFAFHCMVELATNNYIEVYVGNTTDADDVTVKTLNLFAMGM